MAGNAEDKLAAKPRVIQHLFDKRFNAATGQIDDPVVKNDALVKAIEAVAKDELSTKNPANFLKDFLRSDRRNDLWPQTLKDARITARQKYRDKRVFAFAPYSEEQTEPFPDICVLPVDPVVHIVESVSLPSAARALGRSDEAWLIQVCVHQRIVQTQFGLYSEHSKEAIDLFHLQNSVKMTPEIDAIFLLTLKKKGKVLVTLEAKRNEPILMDQIRAQVSLMAKKCRDTKALSEIEWVVPLAAKSQQHAGSRVIGLFEMGAVSVKEGAEAYDQDREHLLKLDIRSSVAYKFSPAVSGI